MDEVHIQLLCSYRYLNVLYTTVPFKEQNARFNCAASGINILDLTWLTSGCNSIMVHEYRFLPSI